MDRTYYELGELVNKKENISCWSSANVIGRKPFACLLEFTNLTLASSASNTAFASLQVLLLYIPCIMHRIFKLKCWSWWQYSKDCMRSVPPSCILCAKVFTDRKGGHSDTIFMFSSFSELFARLSPIFFNDWSGWKVNHSIDKLSSDWFFVVLPEKVPILYLLLLKKTQHLMSIPLMCCSCLQQELYQCRQDHCL